jgi:hypothetical protein
VVRVNQSLNDLSKSISSLVGEKYTKVFVIFCILVAFLIPDTMINYVSDFIYTQLITTLGIIFFIVIAIVYILGQYFTLRFVKDQSKEIRARHLFIRVIHNATTVIQYTLVASLIFIILEILLTLHYHTATITAVTGISEISTTCILSLFAQRFFSWFNSNRKSIVVLLYGLSFVISAFSVTLISLNHLSILSQKQISSEYTIITPQSKVVFPSDSFKKSGSFLADLFKTYQYTALVSFALLMAATAILLHHYSRKLGRVKFWIIILLPMLYRLGASLENFGIITPATHEQYFYWYLYASLNSTAGGILFGIAFLSIAKTIRQDSAVRQYMIIAAYGFILMFISNQVTLTATSYPPYGIATISLLVLASYMIFVGLYSTALSTSQDMKLRQHIRRLTTKDTSLLNSIGTAQMEQEVQRTVKGFENIIEQQEKEMKEQSGVESSISQEDVHEYLQQVVEEVSKVKKNNKKDGA